MLLFFSALITCIMAIGSIQIGRFVHSADFSHFIASHAGAALEAEATLQPLQWNGFSAHSESLTLIGNESTAVQQLDAKVLRARWNWRALLSGAWKIENVEIQSLSAAFNLKPRVTPDAPSREVGKYAPSASFLPSWLPSRFELGSFDVQKANLLFGEI